MAIANRIIALEYVKGSELKPNPRNFRTHPEAQRKAMDAVLSEVGIADAVLARPLGDGTLELIDGHLRGEMLPDQEIPVLVLDVDEAEADKILATHDPIGAMAGVAADRLGELAERIQTDREEISSLIDSLLDKPAETPQAGSVVEDDAPDVPAEPITKKGDVWRLGRHRLVCGSSLEAKDVEKVMGGKIAQAMFTDPPWNVAIGQDSNPRHRPRPGLDNDNLPPEQFAAFLAGFAKASVPIVDGDVYCVLGASEWPTLDTALRSVGYHWSATVIWVKDTFVLGRSKFHRRYEPIWYGWHKTKKSSYQGRRDLDDVWEITRPKRSPEHPTMKPVELVARAIEASVSKDGIVYDPFMGSGTTIMAAEQLGRSGYGLEISPGYCDVIVERYQNWTGEKARKQ